ncbi:MAG: hypothetical protein M5U12_00120 [Verrucomicrobia bacterium]|nr:hypothetical protein [Verrucomicrobiota bacterium]
MARKTLGNWGFNLFLGFTILMLILVSAAFLSATAISLTSMWPLAKIGVAEGETFLKTVMKDGVAMGQIGGSRRPRSSSSPWPHPFWAG